MDLPKLDISALPNLDTLTGLFGSLADAGGLQRQDDSVMVLITFLYETEALVSLF